MIGAIAGGMVGPKAQVGPTNAFWPRKLLRIVDEFNLKYSPKLE